MHDNPCTVFLQWCLPRMGLRWAGFRKVRGTVCKRIGRRMRELGLSDIAAYRAYLERESDEWQRLEALCRIPISRFWRDRAVFTWLAREGLPRLAEQADASGTREVRCWSVGCASGEEIYSLRIAWAEHAEQSFPKVRIVVIGTDADPIMIGRALAGRYTDGSLRDLPSNWRERAFDRRHGTFSVRQEMRAGVSFVLQDVRKAAPEGCFELVLCRNLAFTYFEASLQRHVLGRLANKLHHGAYLVIGGHERLPANASNFEPVCAALPIYVPRPESVERSRNAHRHERA